uniref:Uncharacterized protein n=1 Tax=Cacopsylla melanoneura TaxID=428564 RepID=A0A8D9E4N0_9HEMI
MYPGMYKYTRKQTNSKNKGKRDRSYIIITKMILCEAKLPLLFIRSHGYSHYKCNAVLRYTLHPQDRGAGPHGKKIISKTIYVFPHLRVPICKFIQGTLSWTSKRAK